MILTSRIGGVVCERMLPFVASTHSSHSRFLCVCVGIQQHTTRAHTFAARTGPLFVRQFTQKMYKYCSRRNTLDLPFLFLLLAPHNQGRFAFFFHSGNATLSGSAHNNGDATLTTATRRSERQHHRGGPPSAEISSDDCVLIVHE